MHTKIWRVLVACALLIKSVITMVGGRVVYEAVVPVTTTAAR